MPESRFLRTATLLAVIGAAFVAGRWSPDAPRALAGLQADRATAGEDTGFELEMQLTPEDQARLTAFSPGPDHRHLDAMIGSFDVTVRVWTEPGVTPTEYRGTVTREWTLDGRFVREVVEAPTANGAFRGIGFIGYDNFARQYEFIWLDNQSTAMMHETATYDATTKIMHTRGTHRDPVTGRVISTHGEVRLAAPDRHTGVAFSTAADGRTFKSAELVFTRRR